MNITKRSEYALRTLIRLGAAQKQGCAAVPTTSLAMTENLPFSFLTVILHELRRAGFVEHARGKPRGTRIARPMHSIRIGDVVRTMDGDQAPTDCTSELNYTRCSCPREEICGVRMLMIDVHQAILSTLDRYSLQQLVDVVAIMQNQPGQPSQKQESLNSSKTSHADPVDGLLSALLKFNISSGGAADSGSQGEMRCPPRIDTMHISHDK